ncbi:MAG: putative transposase [Chloroflexia bacterium]|jgi:putative transposase|nr:putative transposase [Chloroflexia bacterium]
MARLRFAAGTRYQFNEQVYIVRGNLADGRLDVENQSFGGREQVSIDELNEAWANGTLRFEVSGNLARTSPDRPIATEYSLSDLQALPAEVRDEAWRRYRLILPLLRLRPEERTRDAIAAYASQQIEQQSVESALLPHEQADLARRRQHGLRTNVGHALSRASIERWLRAFERSGQDIRALAPATRRAGGRGESRLGTQVDEIIEAVLKDCAAKPKFRTVSDVQALIANRIADENRFRPANSQLQVPSHMTVHRRIQQAGAAAILRRARSVIEKQAARSVHEGPRYTHILERVEIDHSTLDLFLVDDQDRLPIGRPTLTFALDVYSGMPYGF